jgi:FlgN protein
VSTMLETELLAHLDTQIASAKRLLATILEQGAAIRAHDVETVLGKLAEIQTEMGRRGRLEQERTALLQRAGQALGVGPAAVTLERMCTLITPDAARSAQERSAELRGLLAEIAREHGINRALMRQELAFLSHLTRLVGGEPEPAYKPGAAQGSRQGGAPAAYRVLDLQA